MKKLFLFISLIFCFAVVNAQKENTVKQIDTKLVNQKLVQLQSNIKKLETTLKEAMKLMEKIRSQKDAISELNQKDMQMLQQLMEKKSQLESMISNVMKAASEAQSNIANNLKSS